MPITTVLVIVTLSLLRVFLVLLWGRFALEWIIVIKPDFRPRGILAIIVETVFTVTDPPIKFLRRVLPPLRLGPVSIDLGWMITMLVTIVLINLVSMLR